MNWCYKTLTILWFGSIASISAVWYDRRAVGAFRGVWESL